MVGHEWRKQMMQKRTRSRKEKQYKLHNMALDGNIHPANLCLRNLNLRLLLLSVGLVSFQKLLITLKQPEGQIKVKMQRLHEI